MTGFKAEMSENIKRTIRTLRRGGVCAMGLDNLRQVTPTPKTEDGALRGVNCAYFYKVMFAEVVNKNPQFKKFTQVDASHWGFCTRHGDYTPPTCAKCDGIKTGGAK